MEPHALQKEENWAIDVKDLTKSFNGHRAVDGVSLKIKTGQIFGFLGANGSGKTTTIRMLCGLLIPDGGSGTCLGYDILTQTAEIKKKSGYMTQAFSLYGDMSVYENLNFVARIYGVENRKKAVQESLDKLGIDNKTKKKLAATLSGGWKQRLALAAAIIHNPKLLLLDEPTAGVDPKARRDFWDRIHELSVEGITTIVSTHYMDEAERCDTLGYLSFGRWLAFGSMDEVIDHAELISWNCRGPNLSKVAEELKKTDGVEQAAIFGRVLHITGTDEEKLEQSISPYRTEEYRWDQASPNLEDAFVHYMMHTKERFAK